MTKSTISVNIALEPKSNPQSSQSFQKFCGPPWRLPPFDERVAQSAQGELELIQHNRTSGDQAKILFPKVPRTLAVQPLRGDEWSRSWSEGYPDTRLPSFVVRPGPVAPFLSHVENSPPEYYVVRKYLHSHLQPAHSKGFYLSARALYSLLRAGIKYTHPVQSAACGL